MESFGVDVVLRWFVAVPLFFVVDSIRFRNGFDPSGHCFNVILSQTMFLKPVMFLHQQADMKHLKITQGHIRSIPTSLNTHIFW